MTARPPCWPRREWLTRTARTSVNATAVMALAPRLRRSPRPPSWIVLGPGHPPLDAQTAARVAHQAVCLAPASWPDLAQRAVEAARTAGARYADARLTRTVVHRYVMAGAGILWSDEETVGVGVRALVNGYWGFAANPFWTPDDVVRLARDAVAQATENANGPPRTVEMGQIPVVTGTWATPVRIDPFTISIEDKQDHIRFWKDVAAREGMDFANNGLKCTCEFLRQERVLATCDGSMVTQTTYETSAKIPLEVRGSSRSPFGGGGPQIEMHGLGHAAVGWEMLLDANPDDPETYAHLREELTHDLTTGTKRSGLGRYTLVCDGATMAALVRQTLGVATQLDRALGYEANAEGTSFLDDPLAMVGQLHVAAPLVTVTANRSAATQLATVQWDEEGVTPPDVTLIQDGVLTDFQTTREQAAWLTPYYDAHHRLVRSNGCAAAQDGLAITLQMMPNLALEPSATAIRVEDLVGDVTDGIFVEGGEIGEIDSQARNGLLKGTMREIKQGKLGRQLTQGAVFFHTPELWKQIKAVGGPATQMVVGFDGVIKGQPPQATSHSVRAAAAVIANQALIDPASKA